MPLGGSTQEEAYAYLDLFTRFRHALSEVESGTNLTKKDILGLLKKSYDDFIPVSVFCTKKLSPLESAVKFLHEEQKYTFAKIARLLGRDSRTIWSTYSQVKKKCPCRAEPADTDYFIPIAVFQDRKLAVLETLVSYLKDNFKLKYSEVARLIGRDQRTVWTVYRRASLK